MITLIQIVFHLLLKWTGTVVEMFCSAVESLPVRDMESGRQDRFVYGRRAAGMGGLALPCAVSTCSGLLNPAMFAYRQHSLIQYN